MYNKYSVITADELTKAISKRFGFNIEKSKNCANIVLDLFGYQDRIPDNFLSPVDRQLLYLLEKEKMVSAERENTFLPNKKEEWTLHYWCLNKDIIWLYANASIKLVKKDIIKQKIKKISKYEKIYFSLSNDVWKNRTDKII